MRYGRQMFVGFACVAALAGCGGGTGGGGDPSGGGLQACDHDTPTACPEEAPTFADVEPIFEGTCRSCHSGDPDGPWPLDDYGHIADWKNEIRGMVDGCTMPPPDSGVTLSRGDRELLLTWIACGMPR